MRRRGPVGGSSVGAICAIMGFTACHAFVNRTATLVVRVITPDAQTGMPCVVTALLFGEEEAQTRIVAGADATLTVGMNTPLKVQAPVKARVALRVGCEGYASTTTPVRDIEVSAVAPPKVDFGVVTVGVAKQ